jgi:hypothetical protein
MMKIAFVVAAAVAVLTTAPLATPAKAQELKMAQGVDIQIGRDRYDRSDRYDRDPVAASPSAHDSAAAW